MFCIFLRKNSEFLKFFAQLKIFNLPHHMFDFQNKPNFRPNKTFFSGNFGYNKTVNAADDPSSPFFFLPR